MKKILATIYKSAIGFVCLIITLWSCTDKPSRLGYDLLPAGDLVQVQKDSIKTVNGIHAFTQTDGNQRTDEPSFNLLGTFNDPVFGKTWADFAIQFRIDSFPAKQNSPQIDSLVLYLLYNKIAGDTITPQRLKVYELDADLYKNDIYYQDLDLKAISKRELLGDAEYTPKFRLDSLTSFYGSTKKDPKDTVLQTIRIPLAQSLAEKLLAADSATLSTNDPFHENKGFLNYFKGLYVEAGDLYIGGSVMEVKTIASGSRMILYYHTPSTDSLRINYKINTASARVSHFRHDYSKAVFASTLDKAGSQDSLLFIQTTGGLRTKIEIPNLGTWKDSTDFAINKAEIIFTVDTAYSDTTNLIPPQQLVFSAIDSSGINKYLPKDVAFSQAYYNGIYNKTDKTYRFNIANHLQQILDGVKGKENRGFYLSTSQPSSSYSRVVLKGPGSKAGIKLEVTYSKIK